MPARYACCHGTCFGEEQCCPTNNRGSGALPTHQICLSASGTECCPVEQLCCPVDGCCDTVCVGNDAEFCCRQENFCPGGTESEDLCCPNNARCCGGGSNTNACLDRSVAGACCPNADCGDPCLVCNLAARTCQELCGGVNEVCCSTPGGPGACVIGDCCVGATNCGPGEVCCITVTGATACIQGTCCDSDDCPRIDACTTHRCDSVAGCIHEAVDCDDHNVCTTDTCDPATGCVHNPIDCDDGNACTVDSCAPNVGRTHSRVDCSGLSDAANCLVGMCSNGTCVQQSTCGEGTGCCGDGTCTASCRCGADREVCGANTECCEGCCLAILSTEEEYADLCRAAGLEFGSVTLCVQLIYEAYLGVCLNPPVIIVGGLTNKPVTLPCMS